MFFTLEFPVATSAEVAKDPDVPMTRPQEMLAEHHTNFGHNSTYVVREDGSVLHVAGSTYTTSNDGGITWSKPGKLKDINGNPVGGTETSLVKLSGNAIGLGARLYETKGLTHSEMLASNRMVFWRSDDGGTTWQPPVPMSPPGGMTASYQDCFLRTSSGRIIVRYFSSSGNTTAPATSLCRWTGSCS
jgi:hypothetical protein